MSKEIEEITEEQLLEEIKNNPEVQDEGENLETVDLPPEDAELTPAEQEDE